MARVERDKSKETDHDQRVSLAAELCLRIIANAELEETQKQVVIATVVAQMRVPLQEVEQRMKTLIALQE